ncbi:hypothetical protein ACLESO_55450 [Pyxidicoccus sp. 3LG]
MLSCQKGTPEVREKPPKGTPGRAPEDEGSGVGSGVELDPPPPPDEPAAPEPPEVYDIPPKGPRG